MLERLTSHPEAHLDLTHPLSPTTQPQSRQYGTFPSSNTSESESNTPQVLIFGSNFAEGRLVSKALQTFYGVGPQISTKLMARFSIHKTAKVGALNDGQINGIVAQLSSLTLENDLRRQLVENIRRLRDMGAYRGRRHAMNLPVRGQRTRSQVSEARVVWVLIGRLIGWGV